ncbi:MAG: hypothetical protein ACREJV_11290 [Candidatus Rokuibacteriota bacterium]
MSAEDRRRWLVLAVAFVLLAAPSVEAACAWVVWYQQRVAQEPLTTWTPREAFETRPECIDYLSRVVSNARGDDDGSALVFSMGGKVGTLAPSTEATITLRVVEEDRTVHIDHRYKCVPDTLNLGGSR